MKHLKDFIFFKLLEAWDGKKQKQNTQEEKKTAFLL